MLMILDNLAINHYDLIDRIGVDSNSNASYKSLNFLPGYFNSLSINSLNSCNRMQ
jgi:hypothetical protein